MALTNREFWGLVHGMLLGALFLLSFGGGLAEFYSLRSESLTKEEIKRRLSRLRFGTWLMAIVAWLTVITGTWVVYPWYRAKPPEGAADLTDFPRYFLLSNPGTAGWHTFGMEWKEHVAWFAPILATVVAYLVLRYGPKLAVNTPLRNMVVTLFIVAFLSAAIAGLFGALITKAAPIL
jgi:hypothetical protein